jgi:outer membrane protein
MGEWLQRAGAGIVAASLLVAPSVFAVEKGDWLVRAGAVWVNPDDDDARVTPLGLKGAEVDDAWSVGYTISYLFTDNFALSLLGVIPGALNHDIKANKQLKGVLGSSDIGDTDVFPPTLTAQWHFLPKNKFRPYVGVGVNYTNFSDEDASSSFESVAGKTNIDIDDSWGLAGEVGLDVDLTDRFFVNASLWYIDLNADAKLKTANLGRQKVDIDINPFVLLLAAGYRF